MAALFLPAIGGDVTGMIAVGLLTRGAENDYGRLLDDLGDRQMLQVKVSPDWTFQGRDIFREQLQVARQPGLRLAENLCQLDDAEGAARREREQPQPGRFGEGAQRGEQAIHDDAI